MDSAKIEYTEYDGYVGYKVFPPGDRKVALLGVGRDQKECLIQIEASIALITEAQKNRGETKKSAPLSIVETTARKTRST